MQVEEHALLTRHNTLRVPARCRYFVRLRTLADIDAFIMEPRFRGIPRLILGGGSNLLLRGDFPGVVALVALRGLETTHTDEEAVYLRAGAGEEWHTFVMHSIELGHAGLENLSLIPGTAGGAPIQNIGAYGVELSDVLHTVETVHARSGETRTFSNRECRFRYRDSIFKREARGDYLVTAITVRLPRVPRYVTGYRGLQQQLDANGVTAPDARSISRAVCELRRTKLPDPAELGNAGSFFKNPLLTSGPLESLRREFADLPAYPQPGGGFKLPAAWLIEHCGWKGRRRGDAGFYERHALVLVNHGHASGRELLELAECARADVARTFGITLEIEPEIV